MVEDWYVEWLQNVLANAPRPQFAYWNCTPVSVVPDGSVIVGRVAGYTLPWTKSYNSLCLTPAATRHQIVAETLFFRLRLQLFPTGPVPDFSLEEALEDEEPYVQYFNGNPVLL